jgi:hypothetical protein
VARGDDVVKNTYVGRYGTVPTRHIVVTTKMSAVSWSVAVLQ